MAIDWQTMMFAFDITRSDGGAGILIPSTDPDKPGVQAAIPPEKMLEFTIRKVPPTEYVEVILKVSYEPGEKCLGLTTQIEEAEKWVMDANKLLDEVRGGS